MSSRFVYRHNRSYSIDSSKPVEDLTTYLLRYRQHLRTDVSNMNYGSKLRQRLGERSRGQPQANGGDPYSTPQGHNQAPEDSPFFTSSVAMHSTASAVSEGAQSVEHESNETSTAPSVQSTTPRPSITSTNTSNQTSETATHDDEEAERRRVLEKLKKVEEVLRSTKEENKRLKDTKYPSPLQEFHSPYSRESESQRDVAEGSAKSSEDIEEVISDGVVESRYEVPPSQLSQIKPDNVTTTPSQEFAESSASTRVGSDDHKAAPRLADKRERRTYRDRPQVSNRINLDVSSPGFAASSAVYSGRSVSNNSPARASAEAARESARDASKYQQRRKLEPRKDSTSFVASHDAKGTFPFSPSASISPVSLQLQQRSYMQRKTEEFGSRQTQHTSPSSTGRSPLSGKGTPIRENYLTQYKERDQPGSDPFYPSSVFGHHISPSPQKPPSAGELVSSWSHGAALPVPKPQPKPEKPKTSTLDSTVGSTQGKHNRIEEEFSQHAVRGVSTMTRKRLEARSGSADSRRSEDQVAPLQQLENYSDSSSQSTSSLKLNQLYGTSTSHAESDRCSLDDQPPSLRLSSLAPSAVLSAHQGFSKDAKSTTVTGGTSETKASKQSDIFTLDLDQQPHQAALRQLIPDNYPVEDRFLAAVLAWKGSRRPAWTEERSRFAKTNGTEGSNATETNVCDTSTLTTKLRKGNGLKNEDTQGNTTETVEDSRSSGTHRLESMLVSTLEDGAKESATAAAAEANEIDDVSPKGNRVISTTFFTDEAAASTGDITGKQIENNHRYEYVHRSETQRSSEGEVQRFSPETGERKAITASHHEPKLNDELAVSDSDSSSYSGSSGQLEESHRLYSFQDSSPNRSPSQPKDTSHRKLGKTKQVPVVTFKLDDIQGSHKQRDTSNISSTRPENNGFSRGVRLDP
eukprot:gb/GECG01013627.1/.p1 GENE.gb/GECG01013627.1/~~gb/GECG01013627.1/.p1  ORF type:complete len:918 (+),score=135.75 gb/GECG01013627.1/:1-2754(+)